MVKVSMSSEKRAIESGSSYAALNSPLFRGSQMALRAREEDKNRAIQARVVFIWRFSEERFGLLLSGNPFQEQQHGSMIADSRETD
jgi:hypothetical protein